MNKQGKPGEWSVFPLIGTGTDWDSTAQVGTCDI